MKRVMVILVVALIVGAIAFTLGMQVGKKKAVTAINGANNAPAEKEDEVADTPAAA